MGIGLITGLIYLPAACLITLGILAAWNSWRPPRHWQVIIATVVVVFVPFLILQLNDLVSDLSALNAGYRIRLAITAAVLMYLPVLVPATLWSLQRRDEDGRLSRIARAAGSLLVAYVVFVILVLPAAFFGFVFFSGENG